MADAPKANPTVKFLMTTYAGLAAQGDKLLQAMILGLIFLLAFAVRLFSVLRYESVIHEFDPYFNFRSTKYLVEEGFYNFHNWFDEAAWYPLGRIVGGTVYPGLMVTAAAMYHTLAFFNITVAIRNICVFLAPVFASLTVIATYLFANEVFDSSTGLVAAGMIAIVPGYISRSVAGSFDNEGIAIFALIFTFYLWVKAVKLGSMFWAAMCALGYFYMVAAWGGYVYIINLIPLHALVLVLTGRYSHRLYVAYCTTYILGTLLSMQVTFVGFQPVQSSEHMAAFGMLGLMQLAALASFVSSHLPEKQFKALLKAIIVAMIALVALAVIIGMATGYISPFTGRFYALLDPTYAKEHIPIIASVSEHQPTTWSSFFFDLHILTFLFPAGLYFCFQKLTDANIFVVVYAVSSIYFAGVMVRLMLILAPIACVVGAHAVSSMYRTYMSQIKAKSEEELEELADKGQKMVGDKHIKSLARQRKEQERRERRGVQRLPIQKELAFIMVGAMTLLLVFYVFHCTWVTAEAYSSPSIVLAARQPDGSRLIFDDFREAYWWLRHNTAPDAKVMSWWDYGYQISGMANRTIIVDNNTWNNTHIAQVGKAMASREEDAYPIMRSLDVDYVLVIFGGLTGYASDDINKFLWMVRIAGSTDERIKEPDYFTANHEFRIDSSGAPNLLNCLMYKMCYYRFGTMYTEQGKATGWDRVRNAEIGNKDFELEYIEEAFTSEHWIVRIYKVKEPSNRA